MIKNPSKRLFILLALSIFVGEFMIMMSFKYWLPSVSDEISAAIDATLLTLIATPVLQLCLIKPINQLVEKIRKDQDELRLVAQAFEVNEGILISDANFNVIRVNKSFLKMTGFTAANLLGKSVIELMSKSFTELFESEIKNNLADLGNWNGESTALQLNGDETPVQISITAVKDDSGVVTKYVSVLNDITTRINSERRIYELAYIDEITKFPNLNQLLIDLEKSFLLDEYLALIVFEPDNFKLLMDAHSYKLGDYFLKKIALRLTRELSPNYAIYKIHGNKFAILLQNIGGELSNATRSVSHVESSIKSIFYTPFSINGFEHYSDVSIGVVMAFGHEYDVEDLITSAQISSHQASRIEGNSSVFYDKSYKEQANKKRELENQLHLAVANKELEFYYQIQVDADSKTIGAEALVRWHHPTLGLTFPLEFIPLAEESLLIEEIGDYLLELGFQRLVEWAKDDNTRHLTLSVNITAKQFHRPNFLLKIDELFKKYPIDPTKLMLELTESISVDNLEYVSAKMKILKEKYNIKLSLDDFGTGYSSLGYLQSMPFDEIKIDRCFIQDVTTNQKNASIVESIIALAKIYNFNLIAEGVETKEQLDFLRKIGCENYQGFFFSEPVPIEQLNPIVAKFDKDQNPKEE